MKTGKGLGCVRVILITNYDREKIHVLVPFVEDI